MKQIKIEEDCCQPELDDAGNCFPLRVPSALQSVDRVLSFLEKILAEADVPETDEDDVKAATVEAVVNAIYHGNQQDVTREVLVQVYLAPEKLTVWVQDEGEGFDLNSVENPLLPENLSKPSGRGILMMKLYMDDVAFYPSEVGTLVKMTKVWQGRGEQ